MKGRRKSTRRQKALRWLLLLAFLVAYIVLPGQFYFLPSQAIREAERMGNIGPTQLICEFQEEGRILRGNDKGLMIFTLYESAGEWDIKKCAYLDCTGPETLHAGFCYISVRGIDQPVAYWYGRIDDPAAVAVRLDVCKGGVRQDTHTLLKEDWIEQDGMVFFALEFQRKWFEDGSILRSQLLDEEGNVLAVRNLDWDTIYQAQFSWGSKALHQ